MPSDQQNASPVYARYTDGISPVARDAEAVLASGGIEIRHSGSGAPLALWSYARLSASEPLRPNAVDVLLSSRDHDGATLFVPSAIFAAGLATRARHLSAAAERWRSARPWIITAAIAAAASIALFYSDISPARMLASLMPDSWRASLGRQVVTSMAGERKACVAKNGTEALSHLSARLAPASPGQASFKIVVVDWALMNAFATPGNRIVLTRGLIQKAESPDEVAGVLAHEMGHGLALHPETAVIRAVGFTAALEVLMGGSSGTLGNIGVLLAQLGYSRQAEREADSRGLGLMKNASISPKGLSRFFKRVMDEDGEKASAPDARVFKALDLLRTHPPTAERISRVEAEATYAATPALTAWDWTALKAICSVTEPITFPENEPEQ